MGKRRIIADPILMLVTILVVTGFQVYWLKNSYDREKRSLQIKARVAFQEGVRHLQTAKLKLRDPSSDTAHERKMKVVVNDHLAEQDIVLPKQEMITMVNAVRDRMRDSTKTVIISVGKDSNDHTKGTIYQREVRKGVNGDDKFYRFLYRVDSLQDSLKVSDITTAYESKLEEEDLAVPFKITRLDRVGEDDEPEFSNVTVGFVHPVTYHLELGNTFPYLVKRISLPILFSVFLVGVTILSFTLLYRNLLKQQRLADLKNEFIGNITHELKTPIATVGVAIEALKNFNAMKDPERTKEYLDISANELQRLGLLVDKVLKLSMFEKKEVELKKETFDLRELLNEVLSIMKLQFEKNGATLNIATEGADFTIEADRLHITSVLYNLLDNALKYARVNPSIEIRLDALLRREMVELKIKDNGRGIPKEYQSKIFEKFFRVPMGDRHDVKGYGLGLSYVSEIVRRHKGFIDVESEPGKGTTFTIRLPRREEKIL